MDNSRPLVPAFLKNIDRKLLLNNPSVWSARTHLVLYFSFLFAAILVLFCMLIYTDARQNSNVEILTGFVVVIAIISFIFWLIYLLRFNVFKRFGKWEAGDGLRTFGLFFINILVFVAIPFIPTTIETFMANRQFSDEELVRDVNELNINANLLEHDRLPLEWKADTFNIFKSTYELGKMGDTIWNSNVPMKENFEPNNFNISDRELITKLDFADSLIKVNDALYIFFTVPDYIYVTAYNVDDTNNAKKLGKKEIYDAAIKNYKKPDVAKLTSRMDELKKKYAYYGGTYYYGTEYSAPDGQSNYETFIKKKYSLNKINSTIETVAQKKFRWDNAWSFLAHLMYYFTLILSLLVFIFRHSTKKTFFLSILAGVVLAIITSLFAVMLGGNEQSFFVLMILYFIAFAVLGFSVSAAKTRTLFQGIGLNFFLFALPFMPLLLTGFYFECLTVDKYQNGIYDHRMLYYFYAEVIGFVLLVALIEPVFKRLYRNWYSLPEE